MTEENKAIVRRLFGEIDKGHIDAVDGVWAPDHVFHTPGGPPMDAAGHKDSLRMYQVAFGDWRQEITNMIAEGNQVVTAFTFHGTHVGELMGIPPTGNRVEVGAVAISRFGEGGIVEEFTLFDGLGMLYQLGAMTVPAGKGES
jgi:predicted ester cyclase